MEDRNVLISYIEENFPKTLDHQREFQINFSKFLLASMVNLVEKSLNGCLASGQLMKKFTNDSQSELPHEALAILNHQIETKLIDSINDDSSNYSNNIVEICDQVIDFLWEHLHTKLWYQVPVVIRKLYAYHQLLKSMAIILNRSFNNQKIISMLIDSLRCIDFGLIMSPDFSGRLLAKIGSLQHCALIRLLDKWQFFESDEILQEDPISKWKRLIDYSENNYEKNSLVVDVPHLQQPKSMIKEFFDSDTVDLLEIGFNHIVPKEPFILRNGARSWPCLSSEQNSRWTMSYLLRKMAYRWVPIEIGSKYTDQNWSQKIMPIHEFIEKFIFVKSNGVAYLAQYNLFDQIIELDEEIMTPDFCVISDSKNQLEAFDDQQEEQLNCDCNAWFGPAGTVSPLHFDARDNIFVQVRGSKYVCLISPKTSDDKIFPHPKDSLLWNTSEVNFENVDLERHKNFTKIDRHLIHEFMVNEGDLLFIPKCYWHFVKAQTDSFSINFWWN